MIMTECLQENNDERHQWFHQTELQCGLFTKTQKPDSVCLSSETAGSVNAAGFDWFAADLGHNVALTAKILVA